MREGSENENKLPSMPREGTCRDHRLCKSSDEFTPLHQTVTYSLTHSLTCEIEIEIEGESDTEALVGSLCCPSSRA